MKHPTRAALGWATALVMAAMFVPPGSAGAQVGGRDGELQDVVIRAGDRQLLATSYRIGRLLVADDTICRGLFTVRATSLEVACSLPGKTEFTVHDVANQVRDRFTVHVLSSEAWILYEELRARLSDIEALSIDVDGPYVLLNGALLAMQDVDRVSAEAERSQWVLDRVTIDPFALVVLYGPQARFRATYEMYDEYDFRHWHTHKHLHAVIRIEDLVVMVLRTEAGFSDIETRARRVVGRLNQSLLTTARGFSGDYKAAGDGATSTLVFEYPDGDAIEIVTARRGDVIGYSRRSLGFQPGGEQTTSLTARSVVDWWGRLITDAVDMYIREQPPRLVAQTAGGSILVQLYERTSARAGGDFSALLLKEMIAQTHPDERNLLEALGARVPAEYLEQ